MEYLVTLVIIPFLYPPIQAIVQRWVQKKRAYERLKNDPLVYVGSKIDKLVYDGSGGMETLMGECTITSHVPGTIEVTNKNGQKMSFTGIEYEKLFPIYRQVH